MTPYPARSGPGLDRMKRRMSTRFCRRPAAKPSAGAAGVTVGMMAIAPLTVRDGGRRGIGIIPASAAGNPQSARVLRAVVRGDALAVGRLT